VSLGNRRARCSSLALGERPEDSWLSWGHGSRWLTSLAFSTPFVDGAPLPAIRPCGTMFLLLLQLDRRSTPVAAPARGISTASLPEFRAPPAPPRARGARPPRRAAAPTRGASRPSPRGMPLG